MRAFDDRTKMEEGLVRGVGAARGDDARREWEARTRRRSSAAAERAAGTGTDGTTLLSGRRRLCNPICGLSPLPLSLSLL